MKVCYKIADVLIEINHLFDSVARYLENFALKGYNGVCDLTISVDRADVERAMALYETNSPDHGECLLILAKIAEFIYKNKNGALFHSSVIKVKNKAIMFSAPSGTGKSTHAKLWVDSFDDVICLNDDKPFIRNVLSLPICYGSPWQGKHRKGVNDSAVIEAICFIERANEPKVERLSAKQALPLILNQMVRYYENENSADQQLEFAVQLINSVKVYKIYVNMERESAIAVRRGVLGDV